MTKVLTVIIPSYNMQSYLGRCLDSLKYPLQSRLQVIIVNDGSKDHTLDIAREYERQWPDIYQVIDKPNGNYGSCINAALPLAKGKYIKVLDADDCFDPASLNQLLEKLSNLSVDMVITDYVKVWPDKEERMHCPLTPSKPLDFLPLCKERKIWNLWMHNVTYLTQHLKDLRYHQTEGISYTDQEWIFQPFTAVRTVVYLNLPLYRYTLGREGQTMSNAFQKSHFADNIVCTCHMIQLYTTFQNAPEAIRQFLEYKLYRRLRYIYRTYIVKQGMLNDPNLQHLDDVLHQFTPDLYKAVGDILLSKPLLPIRYIKLWRRAPHSRKLRVALKLYKMIH
ncbi:glycosyltransferase family 2 protein [Prevotella sp. AGR2160]|uniref:glycosyltransferase family 2 protein n=1 Tax=Prevotella sp. AGR2160 TaxID=1280674 RepID=UPI00040875E0|nr:glycosyltransferase family 2 protein [Prevotella sp. AGR2160]